MNATSEVQSLKQRAIKEQLEQLKKRRAATQEGAEPIGRDADRFADKARGEQVRAKMAEFIAKSRAFRRSHNERLSEPKRMGRLLNV